MFVHKTHCKVTGTAIVMNLDGTITIEPISDSIREMVFDGNSSLTELKLGAMFPGVIDRTENVDHVVRANFMITETIESYRIENPAKKSIQKNTHTYRIDS